MHIPIKVDYGVRALVDLALYGHETPVRATDIARRNAIPEPYLEQLLNNLSKHGLTRSHRGPQGGHALAMDATDISLGMVMRALGETPALVACFHDTDKCVLSPSCVQRDVWRTVEAAIHGILDATTIADLAVRTRAVRDGVVSTVSQGA